MRLLCLLLLSTTLSANPIIRQIEAHQRIGDHQRAVQLAEWALATDPSVEVQRAYIVALSNSGADRQAIAAYTERSELFEEDYDLVEQVAWSTINRGAVAQAQQTQLSAMLGAALTRDKQAVPVVLHNMRGKSAILRAAAAQLSPMLRDAPLKIELEHLIKEDPRWEVRCEAIRAAGNLHMTHLQPYFEKIIVSRRASADEKVAAIAAIVSMVEEVDPDHLQFLATHKRAGLRRLACELVLSLDLDETDLIAPLLTDTRADVRKAALTVLILQQAATPEQIQPLLDDRDWTVALTAAYGMTLIDPETGLDAFRWQLQARPERARAASAALAATGRFGLPLMQETIITHPDSFVRANVAVGLIGQRVDADAAADQLFELLSTETDRLMWDNSHHPLFQALAPSTLRYGGGPNHPETHNQLTRLELLGLLAIIEHPSAQEAVKQFLGRQTWGITGMAAITLVEEGDEAALDLIRTFLDDPDLGIRVQAALALSIWGKDPSAVEVLQEAYPTAHRELKISILEGVAGVGSRESLPFLIGALDDPFPTLRIFSAAALIHCINA
jgi:HEAT repeat protein